MFLKIVSSYVSFPNITECIYEVSINDFKYIYIRKSVYEKLNNGEYYLFLNGSDLYIYEKNGKIVPKLNNIIY